MLPLSATAADRRLRSTPPHLDAVWRRSSACQPVATEAKAEATASVHSACCQRWSIAPRLAGTDASPPGHLVRARRLLPRFSISNYRAVDAATAWISFWKAFSEIIGGVIPRRHITSASACNGRKPMSRCADRLTYQQTDNRVQLWRACRYVNYSSRNLPISVSMHSCRDCWILQRHVSYSQRTTLFGLFNFAVGVKLQSRWNIFYNTLPMLRSIRDNNVV